MLLANLGRPPLVQPDEGRNAEVAREMAASGDWLVPTFNGATYLDKPAFYFACVGLSLKAFGRNEFAARLPSALFGAALILVIAWFCRATFPDRTAPLAAMAVATSPMVIVFSRAVIFDIALTFFIVAAILCGARAVAESPGHRKGWMALGAACAGLGTLVKGPVGAIVPALVLAAWYWISSERRAILQIVHPRNLAIFFALVAPWLAALAWRHPDFLTYGLLRESLDRFTKPVFERGEPFYYFGPVLVAALLPWTLVLPEAVIRGWRRRADLSPADRLLAIWSVTVVVFFSVSRTKHPGYVLPAVASLAVLAARPFALAIAGRTLARALVARAALVYGILCLLAFAAVARYGGPALTRLNERAGPAPGADTTGPSPGIGPVLIVLGLAGIVALLGAWRGDARISFASFLVPSLGLVTMLAGPAALYTEGRSHRDLAHTLETLSQGAPIASLRAFPSGAPFYLGRTITVISKDGSELRSNYVIDRLAHVPDWPETIVPFDRRDAWFVARQGPIFLLVDRGGRDELARRAAPSGASVVQLAPGWWGALIPPGGPS